MERRQLVNDYAEAHRRIEAVISGMDMDNFDEISNTDMGAPSHEVVMAMDTIATRHPGEANSLESEVEILKVGHRNLVRPTN